MEMVPVKSSNLSAVGYDPATETMRVQFAHGGTYQLHGVSQAKHRRFLSAKSKGGYFANHFKDKQIYKTKRLEPHEV